MGLFKKVKDILFDEEEYTEQIKITPEMRNEPAPVKPEPVFKEEKIPEAVVKPKEATSVSEPVNNDKNFPFFDFNEEEFDKQKAVQAPIKRVEPQQPVRRASNVLEYERKRKIEKRTDYGRYEKTEITETIERKKFKPSPIISPVYGILNVDYNKEDLIKRKDPDKVDIQSVRDKAFGEKKVEVLKEVKPSYYEQTETVTISKPAEKERKVKTIDELLQETSDVVVNIDDALDNELGLMDDVIDTAFEDEKENTLEMKTPKIDDTLESDLFDLIDSMYDSKEEGE